MNSPKTTTVAPSVIITIACRHMNASNLSSTKGTFVEQFSNIEPLDPLQFSDTQAYSERITNARETAGTTEAVVVGTCTLGGHPIALGVMNFNYMAGSMGSVVGERLALIMEQALSKRLPLVIVATSGGARMQESILSLMQMAKTSACLARLHEAKLPYISVLVNPPPEGSLPPLPPSEISSLPNPMH